MGVFHHNNEHIVPVPKLIYVANYLLTSGSNTGLVVYSLFARAACTFLLLFLAKNVLADMPWRLLLCALLFPLVMFSAKLTHSYFLGMSGAIWLTADLFVILSAACFAKAIATERPGWLVAALALGVLGVLAYSIETASIYKKADSSGRALALSGFAERDGTPAECIVIVDSNGAAIGAGTSVSERPDLEQSEGRSLGRVG